jgi:hypothetical protein
VASGSLYAPLLHLIPRLNSFQAYKMLCIVQLLMGEIPEKSIFRQQGIKLALRPYFELTNAVNFGNLIEFQVRTFPPL